MGYTVKAMYETAKGIPFLKYFMDKAEMDRFTQMRKKRVQGWWLGQKGVLER